MSAAPGPSDRAPARNKGLLKEKLELVKVKTKDGRTRVTLKPIEDELTFDKGFYVFIRALQLLRSHNEGVVLVGLGGASGSGKTAFSEKVKDFMPGITLISMDNYNDGSKVVDGNFDDPRLTDYDLLLQNLSDLRAGKPADIPIYDFKQSKRVGYNTVPVPDSRVVIIEGIYALSDRLKGLLDLRVSIAGGVHFDLVKRVLRDINRSGQGPEEIIQQITDTVYPMYKVYIEPDLNAAQLKIHNSFNPFTGFMNATYILKCSRREDLCQQAVVAVLGAGAAVKTEAEMYDIHLLPPDEDPETCASWLRMRNRDGRYTLMFEEWVTEGDFIISPRIQFEVTVRVLGGLMSLGYAIGTIMRRTSTLMSSSGGEVTVKFDDVENLGKFVQVQGKDRDKVAATAAALGLSDYIPRSYIEQVQLSKLTQDFQAFTDDVKRRFSMSGNAAFADDAPGTSPPFAGLLSGRGGLGFGIRGSSLNRGVMGRYGTGRGGGLGMNGAGSGMYDRTAYAADDEAMLSCSAPVRGSMPIAIQGAARKQTAAGPGSSSLSAVAAAGGIASPSSSAAAAAGSTVGPGSINSTGSLDGNGSLPGSLDNGSSAAAAAMPVLVPGGAVGVGSSSSTGRAPGMPPVGGSGAAAGGKGSGLLGQQLRRGSQHGSSNSLTGIENLAAAAAAAGGSSGGAGLTPESAQQQQQLLQQERSQRMSSLGGVGEREFSNSSAAAGFGAEAGVQALRRLQDQMEVVSEGFKRHSGMQLHLDALTHQYKHLNDSMAALTAATHALGECVQQLKQQQQVVQAGPVAAAAGPGSSIRGSNVVLLVVGAALGAAVGAVLVRSAAR